MADTIVLYLVNTDSGFGFTTSKSYTFGSKSYDVTLSKLNYNKKVYQPGEIYATIEISADTDSTLPSYMDEDQRLRGGHELLCSQSQTSPEACFRKNVNGSGVVYFQQG